MTLGVYRWLILPTLLCCALYGAAQTVGKITAVTVYRGQALVTRTITTTLAAGDQEVIISGLPENIVPDSLYATATEALAVRSVRYRSLAVTNDPREDVRKIDDQLLAAQGVQRRIDSDINTLNARGLYLDKLTGFVTPSASVEMSKGVLNPDALIKTTQFIFAQRDEIAKKLLDLSTERDQVLKKINLLQLQREQLTKDSSKIDRNAVVFVTAEREGPFTFALNYLVANVDWTPAYSARLSADRKQLNLEYQAVVSQISGEDWKDVALTLSTTRPNMSAEMPALSPMIVALSVANPPNSISNVRDYNRTQQSLNRQAHGKDSIDYDKFSSPNGTTGANGPAGASGQEGSSELANFGPISDNESLQRNMLAARAQNLELAAGDEVIRIAAKNSQPNAEMLAVAYNIAGKVSLASRSDQQMFRISLINLPANFNYTAIPLLTDFIYQGVSTHNTSEVALLPGPYNAYLDGSFAGRGMLPLIAVGQNMSIGFGTETRLRATRELIDKTTDIRGGNKIVKYNYRLKVRNFMNTPASVRIWDRLPQATDNNVSLTLNPELLKPELSTDDFYKTEERPLGLLRWDAVVPAHTEGLTPFTINYQFSMEFDKNFNVSEPTANITTLMEDQFHSLQDIRGMNSGG